jgi:hypothetical protein
MHCTPHQILFKVSNQEKWGGQSIWHVWDIGQVHTDRVLVGKPEWKTTCKT